jgi:hypothetical protein
VVEPVRRRLQHKCLREQGYVFAKIFCRSRKRLPPPLAARSMYSDGCLLAATHKSGGDTGTALTRGAKPQQVLRTTDPEPTRPCGSIAARRSAKFELVINADDEHLDPLPLARQRVIQSSAQICLLWVTFRPNRRLHRRPRMVRSSYTSCCIVHLPAAQISKKHPPKASRPGRVLLLKSEGRGF